jgi:hypothetical protein
MPVQANNRQRTTRIFFITVTFCLEVKCKTQKPH